MNVRRGQFFFLLRQRIKVLRQRATGLGLEEVKDMVSRWMAGTAWCHTRRRCRRGGR